MSAFVNVKNRCVGLLLALLLVFGGAVSLAGCSAQTAPQASSSAAVASGAISSESSASEASHIDVTVVIDPSAAGDAYDPSAFESVKEANVYSVEEGSTAYDALVATGATLEGEPSYVTSINGLGENAAGASSGWMYEVDGEMPMVAANEYVLEGGETVRWYYSTWE